MSEDPIEHFERSLGNVPAPIAAMREGAPDALEGYVQLRAAVLEDHEDGLDLAMKELMFVVLDVVYDNEPGAMNHLEAAVRAGLRPRQLLDALLQTMMVGGIQTWGKSGHRVYRRAVELANQAVTA